MLVELGFRAFDPHELLPHVLATRLGLYEREGLEVRLRDLTFDDRPSIQASCGAALLARLRGEPYRIVLVACTRPLFWIVTRSAGTRLEKARIASYPGGSPPDLFLRMLLPEARLEPARDNDARIGLLLTGQVDGAVVSSAEPLAALEQLGLRKALSFADLLLVPTTGLAVPESMLARDEVAALASALRQALSVIRAEKEQVVKALVDAFRYDVRSAERWADDHRRAFSSTGAMKRDQAAAALSQLSRALGVPAPDLGGVFAVDSLS